MALCIILMIGAVTPGVEIFRGIYHVIEKKDICLTCDTLYSFENEAESYNFTITDYKDHLFFSTFARQTE